MTPHRGGTGHVERRDGAWLTYLRYGLPCAAIWSLYLAAYWPGILTEDSLEQWSDLTAGVFRGYHSPLQTSIHWLLTRGWRSPVPIVLTQIAALSAGYAALAAECAARGAPTWLLAATAVLVAALPANGMLVVTLWKDVPYTIALLWIVALTLRHARRDDGLDRWTTVTSMAVALTAAATFRHNGLPTVVLFLLLLVWAMRGRRRPLLPVIALTVAGVLAVHLGLFRLIGVRPYHAAFRDQTVLHQVAAAMRPGTAFDQADFAALTQLMPVTSWVQSYSCQSVIPILVSVLSHASESDYARLRPGLYRAWRHALLGAPRRILAHHACVSGMIWNPWAPFALVALDIVPNGFGLATAPRSSALHDTLSALVSATSIQPWRAIVWGPALHLFVVGWGVVYSARRRDRLTAVALALPLAHTAVLLLAIPSAEYRLQYPVVLLALMTPLIAASASPRTLAPTPIPGGDDAP